MVKPASKDGLTFKERETIKNYIDPNSPTYCNATESAKKVYKCTNHSARVVGCKAVKKLALFSLPSDSKSEIRSELTVEWVLDKLKDKARNSRRDSDQLKATELIGKYLQMFKDFSTVELKDNKVRSEDELDREFKEISGRYKEDSVDNIPVSV